MRGHFGLGHGTDTVHPPACGLGQWRTGTQLGALRKHTGFVDTRLVARRWRGLGLCYQHAQLAAYHVAHAGRSREYDQQAAGYDVASVSHEAALSPRERGQPPLEIQIRVMRRRCHTGDTVGENAAKARAGFHSRIPILRRLRYAPIDVANEVET